MAPDLTRRFAELEPDLTWSFSECTNAQTGYITHCYHRYPAKFIPQLAARLIAEHSQPGETVLDPFMGSGTTLVEALVAGRRARGIDINPAAVVASRAKVTPIPPEMLHAELVRLNTTLAPLEDERTGGTLFAAKPRFPSNQQRLDWWFPRDQQRRLATILAWVEAVENSAVRDFLRCAFSHCLKTASYWLMKSSKPTRDKSKLARGVPNPVPVLRRHITKMEKANREFWDRLPERFKKPNATVADIRCGDARRVPWRGGTVDLVVTSPPYVTSYEYADLHELTTLWLGEVEELVSPKHDFIGSAAARSRSNGRADSEIGRSIERRLRERSVSKAEEVRQYFVDMEDVFREAFRVLKRGGRLCNVIGNTALEGVGVLNAEAHTEIMLGLGFKLHDVVKRVIPSKTLPQIRHPQTGKFTSATASHKTDAYPEEFIVILEKPH